MLIASGIVLVLITWLAIISLLALTGLTPAFLTQEGPADLELLRRALWWGLLLVTLAILAVSLVAPIHSTGFAIGLAVFIVSMGGAGIALARGRARASGWKAPRKPGPGFWLIAIPSLLAVGSLAAAALGPVTNYDTGLYHLGAIAYAADYAAIPGLANLYQPLGYATAQFPLAAAMGIGPWGDDGFRLFNGLIITAVMVDLVLRFLRQRTTPGTWIQLVATTALVVSMVSLADYWVTSPSQDAAVFALTVVAVAYLTDAVAAKDCFAINSATAMVIAIIAVLIRPTMVFFALGAAVALLIRLWTWRRQTRPAHTATAVMLVSAAGVVALALATARD